MKVQLATKVDPALRRRLRVHAATTGRRIEDLVGEALDGFLPPVPDVVRDAAQPGGELPAGLPGMA